MTYLTRATISVDGLLTDVQSPERGGTCVFLGTVRGSPAVSPIRIAERGSGGEDGGVTDIEYSAYEPMAEAEIERILGETRQRWPEVQVALRHRLGRVPAGEASIAIAAAAPHRAEAFAACRHVIEEVKRRLPVWKKEYRVDGTASWVDPSGKPVAHGP
jgi:molybdopterin synthase catalytic subunit